MNKRNNEPKIPYYDEDKKFWLRTNCNDEYEFNQLQRSYNLPLTSEDIVLDLGGHIGMASRIFCEKWGVQKVVSVEPYSQNCELYLLNLKEYPNAELRRGIVTSDPSLLAKSESEIWIHPGHAQGAHSVRKRRGRTIFEIVPVFSFGDLIEEINPSVVKIDIEEHEYSLDYSALNSNIRAIIIELHMITKETREVKAPKLFNQFLEMGFINDRKPNWKHPWGIDIIFTRE